MTDAADAPTRLVIDLAALTANYALLAARAAPARCAAVVKANAYGLGIDRVAPALAAAGCETFFVATLDEAITLRGLLADTEIVALNGLMHGEAPVYQRHGIVPALNDLGQISAWQRHCAAADRCLRWSIATPAWRGLACPRRRRISWPVNPGAFRASHCAA